MAGFVEFDGELDAPGGFQPFDGELDRVEIPRRGGRRGEVRPFVAGDEALLERDRTIHQRRSDDPRRVDAPIPAGGSVLDRPSYGDADPSTIRAEREALSVSPARREAIGALAAYDRKALNAPTAQASRDGISETAGRGVAEMTGSDAAGMLTREALDLTASVGQVLPQTLKLAADISQLATLGATEPLSRALEAWSRGFEVQKSSGYQGKAAELQAILKNPNQTPAQVLAFLASNPDFSVNALIPSLGSLAVGAGGAKGAQVIAQRLAARRGAAASEMAAAGDRAATLGSSLTNALMNAGDAFDQTGGDLGGKLAAAAIAGVGTAAVGKATRGGAERTLAVGRAGRAAPLREGAKEFGQEGGEQAFSSAGQAVGEGRPIDANEVLKQASVDAALGAATGVGVGALARPVDGSQPGAGDYRALMLEKGFTPAVRVESMPAEPFTPEQIQALAANRPAKPNSALRTEAPAPEAATSPGLGGVGPPPSPQAAGAPPIATIPQGSLAAAAERALQPRGQNVDQPDVAGVASAPAGSSAAGRDQPGGSGGAVGPAPAAPGPVDQSAAAPDRSAGAAGPVADAGRANQALTRLQNRDRSNAGYVQQMQSIAAEPDPSRLSFSRDFATGAPVVLADGAQPMAMGKADTITTAAGRKMPVQYAVFEAEQLLPSNSADGAASAGYDTGAPGKARVVAGNGRAAGLQAAFGRGTSQGYVQGIAADEALHGVPAAAISGMKQPVLVRVMRPEDVTENIGDESNVSGVAEKSALEVARDDVRRLDLQALDFTEQGDVSPVTLRQFVSAMPVSEQTALRNPDGSPTRQAQDRLMAAVFAGAYEDDALVSLHAQAIDPESRVVMGGLASAASQMLALRGAGDLDIRPLISEAAKLAINAKRRGIKLADMAQQSDLGADPDTAVILRAFAANSRSAKKIGEQLRALAQMASGEFNKPDTDMFGDVPRATRSQVLETIDDTARPRNLEEPAGRQPAGSDADQQAADRRGSQDDRAPEDNEARLEPAEAQVDVPPKPFSTAGQAVTYAAQQGIGQRVEAVDTGDGFVLAPKVPRETQADREADGRAVDELNAAIRKAGWSQDDGKPYAIKLVKKPPLAFTLLREVVNAAFRVRVIPVSNSPGDGVQYRGNTFVDVARSRDAETIIGVTGHEALHWLENNDRQTADALKAAIQPYLRPEAIEDQMDFENNRPLRGERRVDERKAMSEVVANLNGSMWLDAEFWSKVYDIDGGSVFRRVLYQFLRAATRFIRVVAGSKFDASSYVTNVQAVRDAAAQAWAARAAGEKAAAQATDQPEPQRAASLTAAEKVFERRLQEKIDANFDAAVAEYSALPQTDGGRIINTDDARELSPDYLADRTRSAAVHEPASQFTKDLYVRKLAEDPAPGQVDVVLFTAGGTGAGKTSGIRANKGLAALADQAQIVFDTNMNGLESSVKKIDQALAAGKAVRIVMTARDPVDALVNGALPRAEGQRKRFGTGRTVPITEHIKTHQGAVETIPRIAERYAGDDRVQIAVFDNSHGRGGAIQRDVAWLKTLDYNEIEGRVRAALEQEHEAGRISEETYRGFAADTAAEAPRSGDAASDRRLVEGPPFVDPEAPERGDAEGQRPDVAEPAQSRPTGLPREDSTTDPIRRGQASRGDVYAASGDPFSAGYPRLEGRKVRLPVFIEDTGQTATLTVDAAQYLRDLDQRRDVLRRLAECVGR